MSEEVGNVNESSFEQEVLASDQPVLVDFWAPWCAPCRTLQPTIEALARHYRGTARVVKVNVDENAGLAQRYGIRGIPTLVLFKAGKEQERLVGAAAKDTIVRMIDGHVERATA